MKTKTTTIALITTTTTTTTTTVGSPQEWRQSDDQKRSQQLCDHFNKFFSSHTSFSPRSPGDQGPDGSSIDHCHSHSYFHGHFHSWPSCIWPESCVVLGSKEAGVGSFGGPSGDRVVCGVELVKMGLGGYINTLKLIFY